MQRFNGKNSGNGMTGSFVGAPPFGRGLLLPIALSFGAFFLVSCATPEPPPAAEGESTVAYEEGVPGGEMVNTVEVSARVTSIDRFDRRVTLLKSDGETVSVSVGPEAVNFDKIEAGDLVKVTLTERLLVYLDTDNSASIGGSAAVMAIGAQGGGLVAETTETVGTVTAIDHERRTATLEFPDGSTRTFPVRGDIDLTRHGPGERVVFHMTEMVAIRIEKP